MYQESFLRECCRATCKLEDTDVFSPRMSINGYKKCNEIYLRIELRCNVILCFLQYDFFWTEKLNLPYEFPINFLPEKLSGGSNV